MRRYYLFALGLGAVALVALAPPSAQACWWGHGGGWGGGYGGGYGGPMYSAPGPAYYGPGPMYGTPPPAAYGAPPRYYGPPPGPVMTPGPGAPGAMRMMPGAPGPVPMPAPTTAVTVSAKDDRFDPPTLNVQPGTTVRFTNSGAHPHTVTDRGGKFDSGDVAPGASYTVTFQSPGTYHYYCKRHKGMEGTITVGEPGKAPAAGGGAGPSRGPTY
jgi:plastocyanin